MLTAYGQLTSYDDFKGAFTELLWDSTRQSEIRCRVYQDRYEFRSGERFSEYYIRYTNMSSMLAPAMSDQDLLNAMVTHYGPRNQACLISANVNSTQEALAVLTKLHSLENSREQYRTTRWDFERHDQTRRTPRGLPSDSTGNRRSNDSVQVRHVDVTTETEIIGEIRLGTHKYMRVGEVIFAVRGDAMMALTRS
jgi:hypothetical protein